MNGRDNFKNDMIFDAEENKGDQNDKLNDPNYNMHYEENYGSDASYWDKEYSIPELSEGENPNKLLSFGFFGTLVDPKHVYDTIESIAVDSGADGKKASDSFRKNLTSVITGKEILTYDKVIMKALEMSGNENGLEFMADNFSRIDRAYKELDFYEDALCSLHELSENGWRPEIYTNVSHDYMQYYMDRIGKYIYKVITPEDTFAYTSDPLFYKRCIMPYFYVAADIDHEVLPARAAGRVAMWMNRDGEQRDWNKMKISAELRKMSDAVKRTKME